MLRNEEYAKAFFHLVILDENSFNKWVIKNVFYSYVFKYCTCCKIMLGEVFFIYL